jgi:hypothetical protein
MWYPLDGHSGEQNAANGKGQTTATWKKSCTNGSLVRTRPLPRIRRYRRSRAGLNDPKRPIGSFIFLGTTGVGKQN